MNEELGTTRELGVMEVMGTESALKIALKDVPLTIIPKGIRGGETKVVWDRNNSEEVENARRTFNDLRKKGFSAFAVKNNGDKGTQIFSFDAEAQSIIMVPAQAGG